MPPRRWSGLILGALLLGAPALVPGQALAAGPRSACLEAARAAERKHDLPDGLLVAVALAESGLHAHALSVGGRAYYPESRSEARAILASAKPGQSVMAGCLQVNTRVHASAGQEWPLDAARSADWAAGYLRRHYGTTGNWADALRRWNGGGSGSDKLVCRVQAKLQVVRPGSRVLGNPGCGQVVQTARLRRDAQTHLELAQAAD